jgi:hypothetical protein
VKEKRKAKVSKKSVAKKAKTTASRAAPSKTAPPRKIGAVKVIWSRIKLTVQDTSKIELALVKPVGVSNFFCLLDAPSSSHGRRGGGATTTKAGEQTGHVAAFDNLGDDSSPDAREAALPQESEECLPPPPPLMPG